MAIPKQSRRSESHSQHSRSLVTPPAELQAVIEAVADFVAVHGPAAEFRLRSGLEGRLQYPFLYLDDQYAPFYHRKLSEARARQSSVAAVPIESPGQPEVCATDEAQCHLKADTTEQATNGDLVNYDDLLEVSKYTYGIGNSNHHHPSQLASTLNDHNPTAATFETNTPLSNLVGQDDALETSSDHVNPPLAVNVHPYGVLQEVHMLDSLGTELSGLNTYIILSNSREAVDDSLATDFLKPTNGATDPDPIYRLRPDVSAVFRARHDRLLPVGLPLGAEVQVKGKITSGVVARRTVQGRQRQYDVMDEHGVIHKDLAEELLESHEGGTFSFRLPNQI